MNPTGCHWIAAVAGTDIRASERCCLRGTALMLERQRSAATLEKIADMSESAHELLQEQSQVYR